MDPIKNPKLLIGGAILGAASQDPEDHPIAAALGMGIGAYVGNSLQISKRIPRARSEIADDIAFNKADLSGYRGLSRRAANRFAEKFARNAKEMHMNLSSQAYASLNIGRFGSNTSSREAQVALSEMHKLTQKGMQSYKEAVKRNFSMIYGQDISSVLGEDLFNNIFDSWLNNKNLEQIKQSLPAHVKDKNILSALLSSSMPNAITGVVDAETGLLVPTSNLQKLNLSSVPETNFNRGKSLDLNISATSEQKTSAIKEYLVKELNYPEIDAFRIASNIGNNTENSKISFEDSKISITKDGVTGSLHMEEYSKDGSKFVSKGGNIYSAESYNQFQLLGDGTKVKGNIYTNASGPFSTSAQEVKSQAFTPVESMLFEHLNTNKPLNEVSKKFSDRIEYIGPKTDLVDISDMPIKNKLTNIGEQFYRDDRTGEIRGIKNINAEEYKNIVENIELDRLRNGLNPGFNNIRHSDQAKVFMGDNNNSVYTGIVSSPDRDATYASRGNISTSGGEDDLSKAVRELSKNGVDTSSFNGVKNIGFSAVGYDYNYSLGSWVTGTAIGDGQSIIQESDYTVKKATTVTLGGKDFIAASDATEKIQSLINGTNEGPVSFKGGELIGFSDGEEIRAPRHFETVELSGVVNSGGKYKLIGAGTSSLSNNDDNIVKLFGDLKSNAIVLDKHSYKNAMYGYAMSELGLVSADKTNGMKFSINKMAEIGKANFHALVTGLMASDEELQNYGEGTKKYFNRLLSLVANSDDRNATKIREYLERNSGINFASQWLVRSSDTKIGSNITEVDRAIRKYRYSTDQVSLKNIVNRIVDNTELDSDGRISPAGREFARIKKEIDASGKVSDVNQSKIIGAAFANNAMSDGKSSQTAMATMIDMISKVGSQANSPVTLNLAGGDIHIDPNNVERGIAKYIEQSSSRMVDYSNGRISPEDMFKSLQDDFANLYGTMRKGNMTALGLSSFGVLQEGTRELTGANTSKATMDWMAADQLKAAGVSIDSLELIGEANEDARYELRSRKLQNIVDGQSIDSIFGDDPKSIRALFEAKDREEFAAKHLKDMINNDGVASVKLIVPEGMSSKKIGLRSLSINLLNSDNSGIKDIHGSDIMAETDKLKRNVLVSMMEYQRAMRDGENSRYIDIAKQSYLSDLEELKSKLKSTNTTIAKAATRRTARNGVTATAVSLTGAAEIIRAQEEKAGRNAVFINEETARSLGFKLNRKSKTPYAIKDSLGLAIRTPASSSLSAQAVTFFVDPSIKQKGTVIAMGENQLASASGDLDDDKIHVFRADDLNNNKVNKELRDLMSLQNNIFVNEKNFLKTFNTKMAEMEQYGVVNPLKSGAKTVAEDQFQENILKQVKSQQRKFSAAEITEFQQLLSQAIERKRGSDLSDAVKALGVSDPSRKLIEESINKRALMAQAVAGAMQENVLKTVRTGSNANSLLETIASMRESAGKSRFASYDEIGEWVKNVIPEIFTGADEFVDIGKFIGDAVSTHGADITINSPNMVGSKYSGKEADKIEAAIPRIPKSTAREVNLSEEVLSKAATNATIDTATDIGNQIISTIKANKKSILLGGLGLGIVGLTVGAESPTTTSPMYNSPTARTNPTLPVIENNSAYITDGAQAQSVSVAGYQIDNRSNDRLKQSLRSMLQGDSASRSTIRFQNQNY